MTFKNRLRREEKRKEGSNPSLNSLIGVVKEQISRLRDYLEELVLPLNLWVDFRIWGPEQVLG
jgi:hypothetical protein